MDLEHDSLIVVVGQSRRDIRLRVITKAAAVIGLLIATFVIFDGCGKGTLRAPRTLLNLFASIVIIGLGVRSLRMFMPRRWTLDSDALSYQERNRPTLRLRFDEVDRVLPFAKPPRIVGQAGRIPFPPLDLLPRPLALAFYRRLREKLSRYFDIPADPSPYRYDQRLAIFITRLILRLVLILGWIYSIFRVSSSFGGHFKTTSLELNPQLAGKLTLMEFVCAPIILVLVLAGPLLLCFWCVDLIEARIGLLEPRRREARPVSG
jgi:hypothetical protein